jgi:hypothetical protein
MDQIVAQALTVYAKIAGMKRLEAVAHKGNGNGHKTMVEASATQSALTLTTR